MDRLTILVVLFISFSAVAQNKQSYDLDFKPTKNVPRYLVETERVGKDIYQATGYYYPEGSIAFKGTCADKKCEVRNGAFIYYFPDGSIKERSTYISGRLTDSLTRFYADGKMEEAAFYDNGARKGKQLKWRSSGMLSDSSFFDGRGNGVVHHWSTSGYLSSQEYYKNDTAKTGVWKYYYPDGKLRAEVNYEMEKATLVCFDETGKRKADKECEEKDAEFPGGLTGWRKFMEKNLNINVPLNNGAKRGKYYVVVQFIIDADGSLADITPLTNYGYGMEKEVIRVLNLSPKWTPAVQFGSPVKAYRKQPLTFVIDY
jgi:antitoxin component YwqK of YwqJK toxin-antitoxin module